MFETNAGHARKLPVEFKPYSGTAVQTLSSVAPSAPGGEALLEVYFASRRAELAAAPAPQWATIAGLILFGGNSAPCLDNEPHEAYHMRVDSVACSVGQAFHAATRSDAELDQAVGP